MSCLRMEQKMRRPNIAPAALLLTCTLAYCSIDGKVIPDYAGSKSSSRRTVR